MQEQQGSKTDWGGLHTHIWIRYQPQPDLAHDLFSFAWNIFDLWPRKLLCVGLVTAFDVERDDGESYEWNEQTYEMELVLKRKISQTMVNETAAWLSLLIENLYLYLGFTGLFARVAV